MGLGEGSTKMKKKEQKIQNAEIRLKIRKGELPYTFVDKDEKRYRKIVYQMGVEMGKKYSCTKKGNVWTISVSN